MKKIKLLKPALTAIMLTAAIMASGCSQQGAGKENNTESVNKSTDAKSAGENKDMEVKNANMEGKTNDGEGMAEANKGDIAPDFDLVDMDGNEFKLSEQKGKKVYVKFWASWCSACLAGMDELNKMAGEDNDFEVVTIVSPGVNGEMEKEDFIKWFKSQNYSNIRVLFDESGKSLEDYQVRAFPTAAYIGSDGVLVTTQLGNSSSAKIRDAFAKHVK